MPIRAEANTEAPGSKEVCWWQGLMLLRQGAGRCRFPNALNNNFPVLPCNTDLHLAPLERSLHQLLQQLRHRTRIAHGIDEPEYVARLPLVRPERYGMFGSFNPA